MPRSISCSARVLAATAVLSLVLAPAARAETNRPIHVTVRATHPAAELIRLRAARRGLDGNLSGNIGQSYDRQVLCRAPCEVTVEPGAYAIGGPGLRESGAFELTGRYGEVLVDSQPGTNSALAGGLVLGVVGYVLGSVGLGMVTVYAVAPPEAGLDSRFGAASGAVLGVGILAVVGGLMLASGSQTRVSLVPGGGQR